MGLGQNYAKIHKITLDDFRKYQRNLLKSLDEISWTSDPTPWRGDPRKVFNCFGYVLDFSKWLEPPTTPGDMEGDPRYAWPEKIEPRPENQKIAAYISAAQVCDFSPCGFNCSWESQFEKIVLLYDKKDNFTHAALQVAPLIWKSKIGEYSDIQHPLKAIFGGSYGKRCIFMKRIRRERKLN